MMSLRSNNFGKEPGWIISRNNFYKNEKVVREREAKVIRLYYENQETLKAIGIKLGVSGERVRQIRVSGVKKLIAREKIDIGEDA